MSPARHAPRIVAALLVGAGACRAQPEPVPFVEAPPPADQPSDIVRFLAIGDAGEGNASQRRNAVAAAAVCADKADEHGVGCHFLALLGDNVYPAGVSTAGDPQWQEKLTIPFEALELPVYALLGNHDYGERGFDEDRAQVQVGWSGDPRWNMPARHYALTAGPARIVALDTNPVLLETLWGESAQRQTVDEALSAGPGPWRVVLGHHPWRSNGQHGNAGEYEGSSWLPVARGATMLDFFETHLCGKADLYLSGHEHNLQRHEQCGVDLVVSGAGAKTTPLQDRGNPAIFQSDALEGFAWIELREDGTGTLEFWDRSGALLHRGDLSR